MSIPHEKVQNSTGTGPGRALKWIGLSSLLLGGLLFVSSPNYRWDANKGKSPYGSDFLQDWTGANMIVSGQASGLFDSSAFDAWQHDPQRIGFTWHADSFYPTVYPPPYYLMLSPLGLVDYRWAVLLWLGLLLGALVAAVAIIERLFENGRSAASIPWFWPAMLLFPPLLLSLTMGQKGTLWLLICVATWRLMQRQRPLAAGLVFGLLSVKPTLFFFLPLVMLYHRQWRFVLGASLSFGGLWIAAACVLPFHVWTEFLEIARTAGSYHQHAGYQLNWSCNLLSLAGGLEKSWLPAWAGYLLLGVLASYVLSLSVFAKRSGQHECFDIGQGVQLGRVVLATCLLSPHFYVYDLVILLLPIRLLWGTHRPQAVLLIGAVWSGMLASQLCQDTVGLPLMPIVLLGALYSLSTVTPGQSSVRNGVSGKPAPSNILQTGLSPQA